MLARGMSKKEYIDSSFEQYFYINMEGPWSRWAVLNKEMDKFSSSLLHA